jgi:hypothetical protein
MISTVINREKEIIVQKDINVACPTFNSIVAHLAVFRVEKRVEGIDLNQK